MNVDDANPRRQQLMLIIVGLAFCLVSGMIFWLDFMRPRFELHKLGAWDAVPCRIERVEVRQLNIDHFLLYATFSYEVNGRKLQSARVGTAENNAFRFDSVVHRLPLLSKFAYGTEHVCRVKPGSPTMAVLPIAQEVQKEWTALMPYAFVAIFVAAGLFMVFWGAVGCRRPRNSPVSPLLKLGLGMMIGGVFLAVGSVGSLMMIQRYREVRAYLPTPAKVLYSGIKSHRSSGRHGSHTTYRVVVGYSYEVDGVAYENDRWGMVDVSTGNYARHRSVADRYRKGDSITVWRSPDDPRKSVLDRSANGWGLLLMLGLFGIAGLAVVIFSLRSFVNSRRRQFQEDKVLSFFNLLLRRSYAETLSIGAFAVVWNLFSWTFVLVFHGNTPCFWKTPAAFVCLFPIFGLVIAYSFFQKLVAEFGKPDFRISLTCVDWKPGAMVSVNYEQVGEGMVGPFTVGLDEHRRRDVFAARGPGARSVQYRTNVHSLQVHAAAAIAPIGGFSFRLPDDLTMDALAWKLTLVYHVDGNRKEKKRTYAIPR